MTMPSDPNSGTPATPDAKLATKDPDVAAILDVKIEKPGDLVPYEQVDPIQRQKIELAMRELDVADTQSIIAFGAKAQEQVRSVSADLIEGVRNKDAGAAGPLLSEMVATVRGFQTDDIREGQEPGFIARLFGAVKPVVKLMQRYETVNRQIEIVRRKLEEHKHILARDVASLDRLYRATINYFKDLEVYIAAGEERIRRLTEHELPKAVAAAQAANDPMQSEEARRLENARNDLERRVHDLKLTRQVIMQTIPSLAMIQDNDKSMITKISSLMTNTLPLWELQVAQSVAIQHTMDAAKSSRQVSDLTNELLVQNAKNLKDSNAAVRQEVERGAFDLEAVRSANASLLAALDESRKIYEEGRDRRAGAERELEKMEAELKAGLLRAAGRRT